MNAECRNVNIERPNTETRVYDLEERLLDYSVRIIPLVEALPNRDSVLRRPDLKQRRNGKSFRLIF